MAALLLSGAAAVVVRPNPAPRPDVLYRKAQALLLDGDFAKAAAAAHVPLPTPEWFWRFRLLEAEALIEGGQPEKGLALLNDGPGATEEFEIRRRALIARRLIVLSRFAQAAALLDEARKLEGLRSRPDLESELDIMQGQMFGIQQRDAEAESAFLHARRCAEKAGDQFHVASSLNNLGVLRLHRFRWDEAVPLFVEAEKLFIRTGAFHSATAAASNLVICFSRVGDFDQALAFRQEKLRLMHPSLLKANALGDTGMIFYLQQEYARAIPYLRQARDMARQFGAPGSAARWAGNLSSALADGGDWDGAEESLHEALDLGPEPGSRIYLNLDAALIAEGRKRWPDARAIYETALTSKPENPGVQWEAYAGIARAAAAQGDFQLANASSEAAIRLIEQSQSSLANDENQMRFLSSLIVFYQNYVDALMTQGESTRALAVADGSRARVLSQRLEGRVKTAAARPESEFQAIAKRSDSVWLAYWLAPRRSFLWVITPQEIRVHTLMASSDEISRLVEEYRGSLERMRDPMQVTSEAGRRLYEILVAPAASLIPPRSSVVIVPDGPLHQLSFQALPVYGASSPHYWVEDHAVSTALSFSTFRGEKVRSEPARRTLLVGDALPEPGFPKLEYSASELDNAEKHLSGDAPERVTKYVGAEARPDIWKRADPGKFDIIHFAAHAEANGRSPLDSAIILSPGNGFRLPASDIIGTQLHAELVTLSACRSSGARTYAGEGLVGLTWAFLQAGSRNVVAGLWDVADQSTARLMDRFYAQIAEGVEPAQALRASQLDLLHSIYAKPYYWAPFQCYRR